MSHQKLFLAITPTLGQIKQLTLVQELVTNLRPVKPVNFHVTLFYIGLCDELRKSKLCAEMDAQNWSKFRVNLTRLAMFTLTESA